MKTKTGKVVNQVVKQLAALREDTLLCSLDQEEYNRVDDALEIMEQVQETFQDAGL